MKLLLHSHLAQLQGTVHLPGSKSISNRVLMIKALSGLPFTVHNLSDSDDTLALIKAIAASERGNAKINIGHAGTDMRFLTAYLATQPHVYELTGSERIQERPIKNLVEVLQQLGADMTYQQKKDYLPLCIKGKKIGGGKAVIDGSVSSQFISALLLVAPYFANGLELELEGTIVSKPYITMTIAIMKEFGAVVEWKADTINVKPVPYTYDKKEYRVESDWSAASYLYSLVALSKPTTQITLVGIRPNSLQADAICAELYALFSVTTTFKQNEVVITKTEKNITQPFRYNFTHCPDIAQTLACTCLGLNIPFYFTGLKTLKFKETDRITALQNEFKKFGRELEVTDDEIKFIVHHSSFTAQRQLTVSTYHDHRMAMAFAPLCVVCKDLVIEQAEVVSKSYPNYWRALEQLGIVSIKTNF